MKNLFKRLRNALYLVLCVVIFTACNQRPVPVKPFIIVYKFPKSAACNEGYCRYTYIDAHGYRTEFCESEIKYSVGDTIK